MEINEIFSKNLIRLRKLKAYSQRDLAKETGLTQRIINYYENKPKSIPIDKLKLLANALNANISDFFDEEETNPLDNLDIRWIKKINDIKSLPDADIKEINKHISSLIKKKKLIDQQQKVS